MQREKVVELARKSGGMFLEQGTPGVTAVHKLWEFWPDGLQEFARLVELESLERAARVCELTMLDKYPIGEEFLAVAKDEAIIQCAQAIRKLKDNT